MNSKAISIKSMGYPVFAGSLQDIDLTQKIYISTLNQYSYCIAEKDSDFKKALKDSDVILPDGMAIVVAVRILTGKRIKKIAGADLHHYLLNKINEKGGRCFYLGASEETLFKIKERLNVEYPKILAGCYSPPYKAQFSEAESQLMIAAVNDFKPDVLFVGMTAPKQEKWINEFKVNINVRTICAIGAVFDFYAGTIERPNIFWIKSGLEWLVRFVKEPRRLWKRYLFYGPIFIYFLFKEKMKQIV